MLAKLKNLALRVVDITLDRTGGLVELVFNEVFSLTEWAFKVGSKLAVLYLLYKLALGDLLSQLLEVLG